MPKNVAAIAAEFQNLHERSEVFVVANPWDRGSARMLAKLGFKALATTSVGVDFADGRKEGSTTLEEMLSHCRMIVDATELPVSGDTESCYAKTPEGVGETIRRLADTGLAGCSIEDVNVYGPGPGRDASIYDLSAAVETEIGCQFQCLNNRRTQKSPCRPEERPEISLCREGRR